MTNHQLDTPPGYLAGAELYDLCTQLYEAYDCKGNELKLYGQRPPSQRPMVFKLWRNPDYCRITVRGHAPGNENGKTAWYSNPGFAAREIMSAQGLTERLGVPPWLLDALTSSLQTPEPYKCYRLDSGPFIIGTLADGQLQLMSEYGAVGRPETPSELRELNLGHFWDLHNTGRLTPTFENLATAGWLWRRGEPGKYGYRKLVRVPNAAGRFRGPGMREPLDLPQAFPMSCYTNVIANIRWMFGTSDLQGPEAVAEVDRLSHRTKNKPSYVQPQLHLLLREGYRLIGFGDWNRDRLRQEGVQYLREHHITSWTSEFNEYWTDERVARLIRRSEVFHSRYKRDFPAYESQTLEVKQRPRMRDVERLLKLGYVVSLCVRNGSANTSHGVLVFDYDSKGFAVYYPDKDGRTLRYYSRRELGKDWLTENGLEAIKR